MKKIVIIKSIVISIFAAIFFIAAYFALCSQIAGTPADIGLEDLTDADNCVSCHRQAVESRREVHSSEFGQIENDAAANSVRSCAECHGNAAEHIQAALSPETRQLWQSDETVDRLIVQPQKLNSDKAMLICASCHGSQTSAGDMQAREILFTSNSPEADFWADKSPRLTGREYQGAINSPCFFSSKSAGHSALSGEKINCLTCHTMHESGAGRITPKMRTNLSCTQCHEQFTESLNLQNHTKHSAESSASSCVSCHMPETVYGEKEFHPTHQISNPKPEMTALKDVPNACNQCHVEQSVNWAIAKTKNLWAGYANTQVIQSEEFNQSEAIRMLFAGDALSRALAAENLRKHAARDFAAPFLVESFAVDAFPIVRFFAANALFSLDQDLPKLDYLAAPAERRKQINRWIDQIDTAKLDEGRNLAARLRRRRKNVDLNAKH